MSNLVTKIFDIALELIICVLDIYTY